jgi:hypothetical protein
MISVNTAPRFISTQIISEFGHPIGGSHDDQSEKSSQNFDSEQNISSVTLILCKFPE